LNCSIFAAITATTVAARLTKVLTSAEITPPVRLTETDDPFEVLRYTLTHAPELAADIEAAFRAEEVGAATTAVPTPGAAETIQACHDTDRTVTIVSNNSDDAVHTYLTVHELAGQIDHVHPHASRHCSAQATPYLVTQATLALEAEPAACVLIGDSLTDVQAAHAAGVPAIGYANKASKPARFTDTTAAAGCHSHDRRRHRSTYRLTLPNSLYAITAASDTSDAGAAPHGRVS
jgi:beta-phosphoglucomutase-like phosphatase (HAD superfamily)